MPTATIRVPATTANLGPGFDCLGLAVALYNEMTFEWGPHVDETVIVVEGEGEDELTIEGNVTLASLRLGLADLDRRPPAVRLTQANRIPLARGLGSSASAIVAGLAAARCIAGVEALDRPWLLRNAMRVEPHPDNIAAAIYGGLTTALLVDEDAVRCLPLGRPPGLHIAFAVPDFRVSTAEARSVLPQSYSREDVVFSASRAAMLVGALLVGDTAALGEAVRDRIHTPARASLIPAFTRVHAAATDAGADAVFISGSGPTVAAFVHDAAAARKVAASMVAAFGSADIAATPLWPAIDGGGVTVVTE